MPESGNQTHKGHRHRSGIIGDIRRLHRRCLTFSELVIDGFCKINYTICRIVSDSLEKFDMEVILRVVDDEFFVEGDGGAKFLLQL